MGGAFSNAQNISRSSNDIINSLIANSTVSGQNNCQDNPTTIQVNEVENITVENCAVNMAQTNINYQGGQQVCRNSVTSSNTLASNIKTQLDAQCNQRASCTSFGSTCYNACQNTQDISNDIASNVNISSVNNCSQNAFNIQNNTINGFTAICPAACNDWLLEHINDSASELSNAPSICQFNNPQANEVIAIQTQSCINNLNVSQNVSASTKAELTAIDNQTATAASFSQTDLIYLVIALILITIIFCCMCCSMSVIPLSSSSSLPLMSLPLIMNPK